MSSRLERLFSRWHAVALIMTIMCGCTPSTPAAQHPVCSTSGLLNRLGTAIVRNDPTLIQKDLLSSSDVAAMNGRRIAMNNETGAREFDDESFRDAQQMIAAIHGRMKGPVFIRSEVGNVLIAWVVEGTTTKLDAIVDSHLIFTDGTTTVRIPIDRIVRVGECWKIETVGFGAEPNTSAQPPRLSLSKEFKQIRRTELCTGLIVYLRPEKSASVGELIEGYTHYRDKLTGQTFPAVLLKTHVKGEIRGRWEKLDHIFRRYCRTDDPALRNCRWSVREEEVTADVPDEIPPEP